MFLDAQTSSLKNRLNIKAACEITKHRRKKEENNIHVLVEKERFQICVGNLSAPANMLIIYLTIIAT